MKHKKPCNKTHCKLCIAEMEKNPITAAIGVEKKTLKKPAHGPAHASQPSHGGEYVRLKIPQPLHHTCPHCHARPGKRCKQPSGVRLRIPHARRHRLVFP